jgi:hypothetical protein
VDRGTATTDDLTTDCLWTIEGLGYLMALFPNAVEVDAVNQWREQMSTLQKLLPPGGKRRKRSADQIAAAVRVGFDYPVIQVGVTGKITVSYDPSLGEPGLALAKQILHSVSNPYNAMQTFFGITGSAVNVVISPLSGKNDGSGGAYHYGCNFTTGGVLYLDATFANTLVNPLDLEVALYVAELSESFMGPQNLGWNCGYSNGEALSRFCAEQTDQNPISTGCGIVYIYWMCSPHFRVWQSCLTIRLADEPQR